VHETPRFVTLPNIHRCYFFTVRLNNKPFVIRLSTTPSHLKYVATLPCNLSLIACFLTLMFSQGSVATYGRSNEIFNNQFTANLSRNLGSGQVTGSTTRGSGRVTGQKSDPVSAIDRLSGEVGIVCKRQSLLPILCYKRSKNYPFQRITPFPDHTPPLNRLLPTEPALLADHFKRRFYPQHWQFVYNKSTHYDVCLTREVTVTLYYPTTQYRLYLHWGPGKPPPSQRGPLARKYLPAFPYS